MDKTCSQCGKHFQTDQRSAKYCSRPCFNIGRQVPKEKPCEICGTVFFSIRLRHAKYCGVACAAVGRIKRVEIECSNCQKVFLPATTTSKYCSKNCGYAHLRGSTPEKRRTGTTVSCAQCAAPIYREASRMAYANRKHLCTPVCREAYQARNKVVKHCTVCQKEFKLSPSVAARNAGRYCSIKCRTACPVWRKQSPIAGNLKQLLAKGPNRLELAGRALLEAEGIAFQEQVLIDGRFTVDVKLDGLPIVIQWDGSYWHGYRAPGDDRPLDARQLKRSTFDRSQDAYMRAHGLTVLRFWEHDVMHGPELVAAAIRGAIPKS